MQCPKCGYVRKPEDEAPEWQCPSCKVAYVKAQALKAAAMAAAAAAPAPVRSKVEAPPPDEEVVVETEDDNLEERHWLAARGQKILIYSILLNFVMRSVEQSKALPDPLVSLLFFCIAAYSLLGVVRICSGLNRTQNQKILSMVLSFFPLINLVLFVYLSIKASRMLREAGWRVGLLGARP